MTTYTFRTPAIHEIPRLVPGSKPDRFWSRIVAPKIGSAVLKYSDGSYKTIDYPTPQDVAACVQIWWGGYVNVVDEAEAVLLAAAGYTVEAVPPAPAPYQPPPQPIDPPPIDPGNGDRGIVYYFVEDRV